MKRLNLKRGKEEWTSIGSSYLCGLLPKGLSVVLPKNLQLRCSDAINDRSLLKTLMEAYSSDKLFEVMDRTLAI